MFIHPTILLDIAKQQQADLIKRAEHNQLVAASSAPSRWQRFTQRLKAVNQGHFFRRGYLAKALFNR